MDLYQVNLEVLGVEVDKVEVDLDIFKDVEHQDKVMLEELILIVVTLDLEVEELVLQDKVLQIHHNILQVMVV